MSWFSAGLDTLSQLSEKVQQAIPVDKELLAKLTLNTDEMKAEREQFGEEAKRKAAAKDMVAGLLPWDTRDKERDILVEECKEAILTLSGLDDTFYGPYEMPALKVKLAGENKEVEGNEEEDVVEDDDDEDGEGTESKKEPKPSEESLEKLSKLEPLPPLLRDFDLDSHVGLIQKLLKEDPKLEERQSRMSGGGAREKIFWQNYFFHCAFTRYEAGLSIDEIWSFQPETPALDEGGAAADGTVEETVVFDEGDAVATKAEHAAFVPDETTNTETAESTDGTPNDGGGSPAESAASEFELLDGDGEIDVGGGDPELDALEAEIARELES